MVSGFSELKDHLIESFKILRPRETIRLYFTENRNRLLMHDYHNHQYAVAIINNIQLQRLNDALGGNAKAICFEALQSSNPVSYLNSEFLLYGFFRF